MRIIYSIVFFIFSVTYIYAQTTNKHYIKASIGLGISAPDEDIDIGSSGFYAQGEYIVVLSKWFSARPYLGFISTSPDLETTPEGLKLYRVTSKAVLIGGKMRLTIPIPYVSPYFEAGIGSSIGSFETFTPNTNIKKSGIFLHVPATLGLALGRKHNFNIEFTYYFNPSLEQFSGAAAVSYRFPI